MSQEKTVGRRKNMETASPARYTPVNRRAYKKLRKKQEVFFDKKFYIGDISVDDDEYAELINYMRTQIRKVPLSTPVSNDPLLCIGLVQIGIRKYNGNYWGNVGKELGVKISVQAQSFLGWSFVLTLQRHEKYILNENERVNSILFHTFVSDYYSNGLFELLFQYYRRDLERDINRNTREQMQALMDTLDRTSKMSEEAGEALAAKLSGKTGKEKGSQSYKLRHHTLDAISANPRHSKLRLHRIIRLIDKAFWNDSVPANPAARLTKRFIEWTHNSPSFNEDYKLYKGGQIRNRGKKHFSSPYLYCDIKNTEFYVVLPAQIVNEEYAEDLSWQIKTDENEYVVSAETNQAVTGFKSKEERKKLRVSELFGHFEFRLFSGQTLVRRLSDIPEANARFFDLDGDFALKLFKIPMCVYTLPGIRLQSPALIEKVNLGDLIRWDFEFEDGDVLVLPDGSSMLAGETYTQGLLPRGKISGVSGLGEKDTFPVYSNIPTLVMTIPPSKVGGTALYINGIRHQMSSCNSVEYKTKDSRGEKAFFVQLDQFPGISNYEINNVVIDVPGANFAQSFFFALVSGLSIDFDSAPYVFSERAAVVFPTGIEVTPLVHVQRLSDENGFVFELSEETTSIPTIIGNKGLRVNIDVPVFLWSVDEIEWSMSPMGDKWISEFPTIVYLKAPCKETRFSSDLEIDDAESSDDQHSVVSYLRTDGIQVVDFTRMRSWLTRDKLAYEISMRLRGKDYSFAKVFVKSFVVTCEISADFDHGDIICSTEIIGKSSYFLSIVNQTTGKIVVERKPYDGKIVRIHDDLLKGEYLIEIFEAEEDESGFDEPDFYSIYRRSETIIDKHNLSGKHIELKGFRPIRSGLLTVPRGNYWIVDLKKESLLEYTGEMCRGYNRSDAFKVKVLFQTMDDLRHFNLQRWYEDDEDPDALMFDKARMMFVVEEESGLHGRVKYLRYQMLYGENYYFIGSLQDYLPTQFTNPPAEESDDSFISDEWVRFISSNSNFDQIKIEDMQLSVRSYNCLRRARLLTAGEIAAKTPEELLKVRNLGRRCVEEIINKIKKLGCPADAHILRTPLVLSMPYIAQKQENEPVIPVVERQKEMSEPPVSEEMTSDHVEQKAKADAVVPERKAYSDEQEPASPKEQPSPEDIDLIDMQFSKHVLNALLAAGYKTYKDIASLNYMELYSIKGFGRVEANEVVLKRKRYKR